VRIPQEFRLAATEVEISRNGDGDLVIHPLPAAAAKRGDALLQALQGLDPEFAELLETVRKEQATPQERDPL